MTSDLYTEFKCATCAQRFMLPTEDVILPNRMKRCPRCAGVRIKRTERKGFVVTDEQIRNAFDVFRSTRDKSEEAGDNE